MYMLKKTLLLWLVLLASSVQLSAQDVTTHIVRRGESFEYIANKYGISTDELRSLNPDEEYCYVGMELNVPAMRTTAVAMSDGQGTAGGTGDQVGTQDMGELLDQAILFEDVKRYCVQAKWKNAVGSLDKLIKKNPQTMYYYFRGYCQMQRRKFKSAIADLTYASTNPGLQEDDMKHCRLLLAEAQKLREQQLEQRSQSWLAASAVVLGVVSDVLTVTQQSGSSASTSSSLTGSRRSTSLDYLLDPRYAAAQVQNQNWNEYLQSTNGGTTMSYQDWYARKAEAWAEVQREERAAGGSSSISSSTTDTAATPSTPSAKSGERCPVCSGEGSYVDYTTTYGVGGTKYCDKCHSSVPTSHYHKFCTTCRGKGYL